MMNTRLFHRVRVVGDTSFCEFEIAKEFHHKNPWSQNLQRTTNATDKAMYNSTLHMLGEFLYNNAFLMFELTDEIKNSLASHDTQCRDFAEALVSRAGGVEELAISQVAQSLGYLLSIHLERNCALRKADTIIARVTTKPIDANGMQYQIVFMPDKNALAA